LSGPVVGVSIPTRDAATPEGANSSGASDHGGATAAAMAANDWMRGGGYGAKDTAARVTTRERGMMEATGHGLCVCFGVPQKIRKRAK
jgi:hypothetical protein